MSTASLRQSLKRRPWWPLAEHREPQGMAHRAPVGRARSRPGCRSRAPGCCRDRRRPANSIFARRDAGPDEEPDVVGLEQLLHPSAITLLGISPREELSPEAAVLKLLPIMASDSVEILAPSPQVLVRREVAGCVPASRARRPPVGDVRVRAEAPAVFVVQCGEALDARLVPVKALRLAHSFGRSSVRDAPAAPRGTRRGPRRSWASECESPKPAILPQRRTHVPFAAFRRCARRLHGPSSPSSGGALDVDAGTRGLGGSLLRTRA